MPIVDKLVGRILVVEDDTPLRNALVSTVQAAGYEVVAVGDGAPAVQPARLQPQLARSCTAWGKELRTSSQPSECF